MSESGPSMLLLPSPAVVCCCADLLSSAVCSVCCCCLSSWCPVLALLPFFFPLGGGMRLVRLAAVLVGRVRRRLAAAKLGRAEDTNLIT